MAVIKVFDAKGVKTLQFLGNANEQEYDLVEIDDVAAEQDLDAAEE